MYLGFDGDAGMYFRMGAPERLMDKLPDHLEQELEKGRRVIIIGYYGQTWEDDEKLPEGIRPVYSVVLEDTIRKNAEETLGFFPARGGRRESDFRRPCKDCGDDCKACWPETMAGCSGYVYAWGIS